MTTSPTPPERAPPAPALGLVALLGRGVTAERQAGTPPAAGTGGTAGARVRGRRREVGLTQQELAARVGVSRQTIISMETGDYAPSVYLAIRIGRELGVTVEDLWG